MAVVFIVQAVLFQDGGITVLGANIFNMGLIGVWWLLSLQSDSVCFRPDTWRGMLVGTAVTAWTSVVVASIVTAIQPALSGTVPLAVALTAMWRADWDWSSDYRW